VSEILGDVKASSFTLCDHDGNVRARLRLQEGEPTFGLIDDEGRVRAELCVDKDGNSKFLMAGPEGSARIGMDLYENGPSIFLRDASGQVRIGLDFAEDTGTAVLALSSDGKQTRLSISCSGADDSVNVRLFDSVGRCRVEMQSREENHAISFYNEKGVAKTVIEGNSLNLVSNHNVRSITYDEPSGTITRLRCVITKPLPVASWKDIVTVTVIGFYAMPGVPEEYRTEYLRRIGDSADALLNFIKKDVSDGAKSSGKPVNRRWNRWSLWIRRSLTRKAVGPSRSA
jgi:hypothetical protein